MKTNENCPVCGSQAQVDYTQRTWPVDCLRCGTYSILQVATIQLQNNPLSLEQVANASGWIRDHPDVVIGQNECLLFKTLQSPTVGDKATKLLLTLSRLHQDAGEIIEIRSSDLDPDSHSTRGPNFLALQTDFLRLAGSAWIKSMEEFDYLVKDYLCGSRKFLVDVRDHHAGHMITPEGWAFLDGLQRGNTSSRVGFIAMWFEKELDPVHLAIESAVRNAGYDPKRIDRVEHNNRIDDEIIAWIRRSKFVVADMTGNRGGVYFESGYALGMGLQVIWLCREEDLPNVHFDNRQYNFIIWSLDRLPELTQRLQNRIEATIGRLA
jgi:hypothetical protein